LQINEDQLRMPKPFDPKTQKVFEDIRACGQMLGIKTQWREGGGVCDGNNLSAAGLPTIDSIGVIGGNIHTSEEYILIDSLYERARLVTLYLIRLAIGDINHE
jgi:glutamate carboxypeptidase